MVKVRIAVLLLNNTFTTVDTMSKQILHMQAWIADPDRHIAQLHAGTAYDKYGGSQHDS